MAGGTEIELKLAVRPTDADALLALDWVQAAHGCMLHLAATYYDTPDGALRKAGFALRIRDEDGSTVQTVKAGGKAAGLFARPEWNCPIDHASGPRLDASAGPLGEMLDEAQRAALTPVFTTRVERHRAIVRRDDAVIELAIDRGTVVAGAAEAQLCEVELELMEGPPAALFGLARLIDASVPTRIGIETKASRGQALAAGRPRKPVKSLAVMLDPDDTAADAFAAIAQVCMRQFRHNEDLLADTGDAAALHQARVALRRMRSAFSLFKPVFADDSTAARLRAELRWLQGALGDARDIDVLLAGLEAGSDDAVRLSAARSHAYAAAANALRSDRARHLSLDLVEWLSIGDWREGDAAARPIADTAILVLDRQRRRLRRDGRHLVSLGDEERHRVRIEAKKLRYATEFLAGLYDTKKGKRRHARFLAALEVLQERLGTLNDLATAPRLRAAHGLAPASLADADRDHLIAVAADAYAELIDARRFWR